MSGTTRTDPRPHARTGAAPMPPARGTGIKRALLGPALPTAHLVHERLGKPTALAVFCLRRAVVGRLRDRGDPADPADRRASASLAFALILPIIAGDRGRARDPDLQLPPDDQGLPVGRRRLHRHEGQPRAAARPGGRRRAAHRLRPHRRGVGVRRRRGDHSRACRSLAPYRVPMARRLHRPHRLRQPPRASGSPGRSSRRPTYVFIVHHVR